MPPFSYDIVPCIWNCQSGRLHVTRGSEQLNLISLHAVNIYREAHGARSYMNGNVHWTSHKAYNDDYEIIEMTA